MNEEISITTERVDDIPILTTSMERMGVTKLFDEHFLVHGSWQGTSSGEMMDIFLNFVSVAGPTNLYLSPLSYLQQKTLGLFGLAS